MNQPENQKKAVLGFRKAWKSAPWVPISQMQAHSFRERPLKGPILVTKVEIPAPNEQEGEALRSQLWDLFQATKEGVEKPDPPAPCISYKGEWIGVRKDAAVKDPKAPQPNVSDQEKFQQIQHTADNDKTIFYLSGGAYFRAGPPGARPLIKQLVETSGSRAFTFQPRVAPQYTMLSILLDIIAAYFYLVAPPPGALHKPVDPEKIILVGESAGSVNHLHLLQFLRAIIRSAGDAKIEFYGQKVPTKMPLGCAFISPGADFPLSLPSVKRNEWFEWMSECAPWLERNFPADDIWPTSPPRGDLHCDNSVLCHPLIDPSTETDWSGMPPMWIACGQETFEDGIKFLVKNIHASGVPIKFVQYEFMPHVWNVILPRLPQSHDTMKRWGLAIKEIGQGNLKNRDSSAHFVKLGKLETVPMVFERLLDIPKDEVLRRMRAARDELAKFVWIGHKEGAKL